MISKAVDLAAQPPGLGHAALTPLSDQPYRRQHIRPLEPLWRLFGKARASLALATGACHTLARDWRERRAGATGRLRLVRPGVASGTGRSLALYAHYAPHGGISEMVLCQLRDYARLGFRIVFISAAPTVQAEAWEQVCGIAEVAIHRRNHGFDFGAWSDALALAPQAAEPLDELLLVNDSVLGPLHALDQPLGQLRASGEGLFGLTEGVQHAPHLQSYFLLARGSAVIADVRAFLRDARLTGSKRLTVRRGEIGLTQAIRAQGHHVAALWSYAAVERAMVASEEAMAGLLAAVPQLAMRPLPAGPGRSPTLRRALLDLPLNPVHHFASLLVRHCGFPFLKTEWVLRNPVRSPEAADWQTLVPPQTPVPLPVIVKHLVSQQRPPRPVETPVPAAASPTPLASTSLASAPLAPAWRHRLDEAWARRPAGKADPASIPPLAAAGLLHQAAQGDLVLAFGHDDYASNVGGVQNVIGAEQRAFASAGIGYLYLAPLVSLPSLAELDVDAAFLVRLDGTALGVARLPDLLAALTELGRLGRVAAAVVHHLAGHAPEQVLALLQAAQVGRPLFWLHDFASLCPSPALLRNDIVFCGAPAAGSGACAICVHGATRSRHLARVRAFLAATRPQVLAPSAVALAFWRDHGGPAGLAGAVLPPARLGSTAVPLPGRHPGRRLRVAHLGTRDVHKGWQAFLALASRFADDPRYAFLQLGIDQGAPLPASVRCIPVRVEAGALATMADAVADQQVDIVVNWSLCLETFSFTVHEAMAGGAFVVARAAAGNVWPAVQAHAPDRGQAVADEAALVELFAGSRLMALLADAPAARRSLTPSGASAEWLLAETPARLPQHG